MVGDGTLGPFLDKVDEDIKNRKGRFTKTFKKDVRDFLEKKRRPINKKTIKRARAKLRKRKARQLVPKGKDVSGIESDAPWQIVYGSMRIGGVMTFMASYGSNNDLDMIFTLTGHEIESVDEIYLDDTRIIFGGAPELGVPDPRWAAGSQRPGEEPQVGEDAPFRGKVFLEWTDGNENQGAIGDCVNRHPGVWTTDHRQRGCAHAYVVLVYDGLLFAEGIPDISFQVRGKKVYDPRTGLRQYSTNAALCLADVLTDTRYGLGAPQSEINEAALIDAANICDEVVDRVPTEANPAVTEPRYCVAGSFDADLSPGEALEELSSSIGGGSVTYVAGQWKIFPGKFRPVVLELTEDDARGPLSVTAKVSRRDTFNSVKGTFVSEDADFEVTDFPKVVEPFFVQQDGDIEIYEDISFPFCTSTSSVQRLAKIEVRKIRQDVFIEGIFSLKAYELEVSDTVEVTLPRLGFQNKLFEVNEMHLTQGSGDGGGNVVNVYLSLQETAQEVYDFELSDLLGRDPSPNTNLPNPFNVIAPTNVSLASGTNELFIKGDGSVFSRIKVSWDLNDDAFVANGGEIEIEFKPNSELDDAFEFAGRVPGSSTFAYILEVEDGVPYDVRLRAKNGLGAYSAYTRVDNHIVIGKTAPPSNVTGVSAQFTQFGVKLDWGDIPDLDLSHYELRLGIPGDTFDTAEFLGNVSASTFTLKTQAAGTYVFFIKAFDTSGNESVSATQFEIEIAGPAGVTGLGAVLDGPDYVLSWVEVPPDIFQIEQYLIFTGDDFNTATFVAATKANSFRQRAFWGGLRRFWLVAQDVAGNFGTEVAIDLNIQVPTVVRQFASEVVDNNVLLRWLEPAVHSLPIEGYEVRRSDIDDFDLADVLGTVNSTFQTVFEILANTYYYWVTAIDSAGNRGPERQVIAVVDEPPDFEIFNDQILDLNDADNIINMTIVEPGPDEQLLVGPTLTGLTWEQYFTFYGFSTIQDRIDAGFPIYGQPNAQWGYFEKTVDFGTIIPATLIKVSFLRTILAGTINITTTIGYSLDGISYIETEDVSQLFAADFQFVRIKILIGCPPGSVPGQTIGMLLALTYDGTTLP